MITLPNGIDSIHQATGTQRKAVGTLVQTVFGRPAGQPPGEPAQHIYGARHFRPEEWHVAEANGNLVGVVGFLSRQTPLPVIPVTKLPWAVGLGVGTHPDWRGRGIMSQLLLNAIAEMDERGVPISFLRGIRTRYGRFGWAEAGKRLALTLSATQFPDPGWAEEKVVYLHGEGEETAAVQQLSQQVITIQQTYRGGSLRPVAAQEGMLARSRIHTFIVETDSGAAYAIVGEPRSIRLDNFGHFTGKGHLLWLYELVGEEKAAIDLLGYILKNNEGALHYLACPWLSLPGFASLERSLWQRADAFYITTTGMVRIHRLAELLKVYSSWWAQYPPTSADSLVLRMKGSSGEPHQLVRLTWTPAKVGVEAINDSQVGHSERVICADRLSMAQAVFGPLDPSAVLVDQPEAWRLNALFPIPLELPRLDQI